MILVVSRSCCYRFVLEVGMTLLNKTPEEITAANSFRKVMKRTGISFTVMIILVVASVLNVMYMVNYVKDNMTYFMIPLGLIFFTIFFLPVFLVINALITRKKVAKD